jgi:serine/threonine-protein kinase
MPAAEARFHFPRPYSRFHWQTKFLLARGVPARRGALFFERAVAYESRAFVRAYTSCARMATVESTHTAARHDAPVAAPQLVGRLGAWKLVKPLSEGNFTRVYQARPADTPHLQPAAYVVKVLRKEWWRDAQAIEMQRREAWVGNKVSHPNLLPVLSASVQEPPFYLVMPKVEGATLAEVILEHKRLSLSLALWIARQTADGLAALFDGAGVIHTDIKPANVLVSPTGHATLIDFGFVQTPVEASHWATRPLAGTLAYIAPELLTSTLAAGPRSDIYSLGVTLYEMLAGQRPWETDDPGELATLHREAKPIDIRALRPDTPDEVANLVHSMLAKDPLRRPASAQELSTRLVRLEIKSFTLL